MCNHESDNTQVQIKSFSAVKTGISYLIVLFHNLIMFVVKLNAFASVTPGTLISTLKQFTMTYRIKKLVDSQNTLNSAFTSAISLTDFANTCSLPHQPAYTGSASQGIP